MRQVESVALLCGAITSSWAIENCGSDLPADINFTWRTHKRSKGRHSHSVRMDTHTPAITLDLIHVERVHWNDRRPQHNWGHLWDGTEKVERGRAGVRGEESCDYYTSMFEKSITMWTICQGKKNPNKYTLSTILQKDTGTRTKDIPFSPVVQSQDFPHKGSC